MVGFTLEVAVTVAVPMLADVTKPEVEIVATEVGLMVQPTEGLVAELPSLLVPTACIWTVLPVFPIWMVGDAGPTEMLVSVGFTKNPVQLTAKARVVSAAKAPMRRGLCVVNDIIM